MSRSRDDLLFYGKDLSALIRAYEMELRKEVDGWERNRILAASETDLIQYLIDKYTLEAPVINGEQVYVESEGGTQIDVAGRFEYDTRRGGSHHVPGSYVTVAIPFDGDPDLFEYQSSTFSLNPPRGRVSGNQILVTFQDVKLDPMGTRQQIDAAVGSIEKASQWTRGDCVSWNNRLPEFAEQCVKQRKERLLEQADSVSALGLPIKRRADAPTTFAAPISRRKPPVSLPLVPKDTFKPEPALPDEEYDHVLSVVDLMSQSIERSPKTFFDMEEEEIRNLILVNLNGHYEGGATGETFNAKGKTDILIREEGKNVFIAECKFWAGPKMLIEAVDQMLGYLTWRDTKAALIIFSKKADFTKVLGKTKETIPKHPLFKRELKQVSETHFRYLFRQKGDSDRDLYLAVLVFNIPRVLAN